MTAESTQTALPDQKDQERSMRSITAAVVIARDGGEVAYPMFDVHDLSPEGAFFASALFLEEGEELLVELTCGSLPADLSSTAEAEAPVRARARVVTVVRSETPGMTVVLDSLSERDRATLERWAARAAAS